MKIANQLPPLSIPVITEKSCPSCELHEWPNVEKNQTAAETHFGWF